MARTDTLPHFLTDVADAIREKGGTSETIQASSFDTAIANLPSGGGAKVKPKTISFSSSSATSIDVSALDLTDVYSASTMFSDCYYLKEIVGLSSLDTSNIAIMTQMFQNCGYFASGTINFDFSNFSINSCSNLEKMFMGFCHGVSNVSLDLRNFKNTNMVLVGNMFSGCTTITHIDLRQFDFVNTSGISSIFGTSGNGVPNNCEIIVADQTQKDYINTNVSRLTNVKTVAEYEE